MARQRRPRGLRRRLILAFVLLAAASAGALAVASYALVRQARLDALLAVGQAEITDDLRMADGITPGPDSSTRTASLPPTNPCVTRRRCWSSPVTGRSRPIR
jgi:pimeloyl-ACP methyl ester carboxylesterase